MNFRFHRYFMKVILPEELFGKTLNVRRKMELFMDYHMSQKTKMHYLLNAHAEKKVSSKNSIEPR